MLKTKYFEMKQLIASLEEISEDTTGEFDSLDDQELQDAQIALEGYQDLLLVNQKLTKQGIKIDESVATGLLSLASPKINKDPLLKNYSEESVADKAKDFGKWILEKIKALFNWIRSKVDIFWKKALEIKDAIKKSKFSELVNKLEGDIELTNKDYIKLIGFNKSNKYYSRAVVEILDEISRSVDVPFSELKLDNLSIPFKKYQGRSGENLPGEGRTLNTFPLFVDKENFKQIENRANGNNKDPKPIKFLSYLVVIEDYLAKNEGKFKEDTSIATRGDIKDIVATITEISDMLSLVFEKVSQRAKHNLTLLQGLSDVAAKYPDRLEAEDVIKPFISESQPYITDCIGMMRNILMTTSIMQTECETLLNKKIKTEE